MPSTSAHAAASRRSVAVLGSSGAAGDIEFSGERQECLTLIFPFLRKWQRFRQWIADGTMLLELLGELVPCALVEIRGAYE